ncbi:hypothetical protein B2J93_4947 [Marssonina coronariae]|uniref:Uncharacterized protein n=1 Tax=Diplocarpon coronariae TaxID=2795749 RepID=A0A218ZA77_9HELO|nr:hypothetical protein B2J93_4947 [Marssonina coronariae]
MDQFKERTSAEALGSGKSKIIAALLDPALFEDFTLGIYSTLGAPYALSNTTLLDNCAATHLVNREELLVPGSLKIAHPQDCVEAGSSSLPIRGRGIRLMKGVLADGGDLELRNVALVDGFNVNIISEPLLKKAGVWYMGLDATLRRGTADNNVVVKQLERRSNVTVIWVLKLRKVIISRNVEFDESKFYSKEHEKVAGHPLPIIKEIVQMIEEEEEEA